MSIPVLGSGDCVTAHQVVDRHAGTRVSGVLVGRGALRNPWIFQEAMAIGSREEIPAVTGADRGQFLLDYIALLLSEGVDEKYGFRHTAPMKRRVKPRHNAGRERWVVNKLRALGSWYTKGSHGGSQLRIAINQAMTVSEVTDIIKTHFFNGCSDLQPA